MKKAKWIANKSFIFVFLLLNEKNFIFEPYYL